jgi:ubiquinone biosynthesis protein Coq4
MTLDLGAIALSMMRVEGWGEHVRYVRTAGRWRTGSSMGVRWEEGLDKPVEVWRKELNIEPIRHGQNSWYEVLAGLEL